MWIHLDRSIPEGQHTIRDGYLDILSKFHADVQAVPDTRNLSPDNVGSSGIQTHLKGNHIGFTITPLIERKKSMKTELNNQTVRNVFLLFAVCTSIFVFSVADVSFCADGPKSYENSQVLEAGKILPSDVLSGPNHKVDGKVQNDGFLNHYVLKSNDETYDVVSTFELNKRVREIKAITEMKKIDTSGTVGKSVVDSGKKTVTGITNLFLHPVDTVEGTVKGVGSVYNRASEAVTSTPSQTEDSRVEQFIGYSKSKRDIANKMGVDVYSENKTLQSELERLAWADYSGGIGVSAGLALVPGGAGVLLSVSGGARLLNETINLTPPTELRHQNRQKLLGLGMNSDTIDLFINNTVFSPRHQTWLVAALEKMKGASNRELFLKVALQAHDRTMALMITQMTMMFAGYHTKIAPIDRFYPIARVLYAKNNKAKVVMALPADHILWSERFAGAVSEITKKTKGDLFDLWTAGSVSKKAEDHLAKSGWVLHTDVWAKLREKLEPKSQ